MSEAEILDLLRDRNPEFLEKLFTETNPYLLKILGSQRVFGESAHDLVQSAWETFFAGLEKFQGRSQIKVFIAGILLNKLREHRRYLGKAVYKEDAEEVYQEQFSDGWWNNQPQDPHQLLNSHNTLKFIEECLEGLSEYQHEAFYLKEVDGENTEQICNILGLNVSHLGVLLFRAKDKLKKCLEGKLQ